MRLRPAWAIVLVFLSACSTMDSGRGGGKPALLDVARAVEPTTAKLEIALKYDKGMSPRIGATGGMSTRRGYYGGGDDYVKEERPLEIPAVLLAPDRAVVNDPMIHPRFISKMEIVKGDERVAAEPVAFLLDQPGMVLKLASPLKNARPMKFDRNAKGPWFNVSYDRPEACWEYSVTPFSPVGATVLTDRGRGYRQNDGPSLVVAADGTGVGLCLYAEMPLDDSWKGSPLDQPMMSAEALEKATDAVRKRTEEGLPRVLLNFRSPKASREGRFAMRFSDDEGTATEQNALGILLDSQRVLVLANMQPNVTARLEKITIFPPAGGDPIQAAFECTLEDFGALIVKLEKPLEGVIPLSPADIVGEKGRLLVYADITVVGEQRIPYFGRHRITSLSIGRRNLPYPDSYGSGSGAFIFDTEGRLVTIPLPFREKVGASGYWGYSGYDASAIPVAHLKAAFDDPNAHCDASNVPLSEEEEGRLAWMGVELQPMNRDLARANKVSELTQDGQTGALVSYVYPDSPAARAGVKTGDILLRLHVEGQPAPVEIRVQEPYFGGDFPWDRYGELPEQVFERIPQPWPQAENPFTRLLTDLGIGKKYAAEFFRDGKVETEDFTIVLGPTHYDTAAKFKSKPLGLTVRNLTMEVRRYFQRKPDDPGVIISKIEMGSKASIAGLKPYEIITHVNDQPVDGVADFEKLLMPGQEMRLSVLRMTQTRVVKISMPSEKDAEPDKAE